MGGSADGGVEPGVPFGAAAAAVVAGSSVKGRAAGFGPNAGAV
jgi:hypothetical protein